MKRSILTGILLLIALCGMAGLGGQSVSAKEKAIDHEQAKALALKESNGGLIERFKFQNKLGVQKYFFTIRENKMQYILEIDATTGETLKKEIKQLDEAAKPLLQEDEKAIGTQKALDIAFSLVPKGNVAKCKFVNNRVGTVYNVIIINGDRRDDLHIDAFSGEVKKHDTKTVVKKFIEWHAGLVTPEQAQQIALAVNDGLVVKCKLYHEKKHDMEGYKVDIIKDDVRYSHKVDGRTGKIVETNINYIYNQ